RRRETSAGSRRGTGARPRPLPERPAARRATSGRSQAVVREVEERTRRARLDTARGADEEDVALELEALDTRLRERAGGEIGLDRAARDERHAVTGTDGAQHRFLQAELEPHAKVTELRAA